MSTRNWRARYYGNCPYIDSKVEGAVINVVQYKDNTLYFTVRGHEAEVTLSHYIDIGDYIFFMSKNKSVKGYINKNTNQGVVIR